MAQIQKIKKFREEWIMQMEYISLWYETDRQTKGDHLRCTLSFRQFSQTIHNELFTYSYKTQISPTGMHIDTEFFYYYLFKLQMGFYPVAVVLE
jgi:hypothetical protein